jgi:hypothetical protein
MHSGGHLLCHGAADAPVCFRLLAASRRCLRIGRVTLYNPAHSNTLRPRVVL